MAKVGRNRDFCSDICRFRFNRKLYKKRHPEAVKIEQSKKNLKTNSQTIENATNNSKRWTDDEERELLKLRERGLTRREIAIKLNRTFYAVSSRLKKLLEN